ncbi:hypothetical protein KC573_03415, partial [candidate division WWE3 bacterium]|nr:hypothetical protein [candidate division WWE3 bacterium]
GIIHDPKFDQTVPNRARETYGYRYDQYNPDTQKTDQSYFRLWCYLEKGERYFITPNSVFTEKQEENQ